MNYDNFTDEELVIIAQNGDVGAKNSIIKRYESEIIKIIRAKNYYLKGGDEQDLIQRGRMAILYAINGS